MHVNRDLYHKLPDFVVLYIGTRISPTDANGTKRKIDSLAIIWTMSDLRTKAYKYRKLELEMSHFTTKNSAKTAWASFLGQRHTSSMSILRRKTKATPEFFAWNFFSRSHRKYPELLLVFFQKSYEQVPTHCASVFSRTSVLTPSKRVCKEY